MPGFGLGGMLPGVGRLPPDDPPPGRGAGRSPPGRSPPGRSPPGRSPPGRGGRSPPPPPCWPPPGRGPVGRGAGEPEPTPKGLLPTRGARGPGLGPAALGPCGFGGTTELVEPVDGPAGAFAAGAWLSCSGLGATGAADSTLATGATCCGAGRWAGAGAGAGFGPGRGPGRIAGRGVPPAEAGVGADGAAEAARAGAAPLLADAAGRGGAGIGAGFLALPLLVYASRSRRATGASTVEDADFTNSPCSFSLARTSLLVTPSSFASSCTRALPGTALLFWGGRRQTRRPRPIVARSWLQLHG
jgi:hypothetical protein